jgi:hypothetical protein
MMMSYLDTPPPDDYPYQPKGTTSFTRWRVGGIGDQLHDTPPPEEWLARHTDDLCDSAEPGFDGIERSTEALVAAKWWADQLRSGFSQSNRADDPASQLAGVLLTTKQRTFSEETIAAFESVLARLVDERLAADPNLQVWVQTDYSPNAILREAAEEAGITLKPGDMTTFPMKTSIRVRHGEVVLSSGGWTTLWSSTDVHGPNQDAGRSIA